MANNSNSFRPKKPKTLGGWIGLIGGILALICLTMSAGAWVYKVESGYSTINKKLDKISTDLNTRLNKANTIMDQRFRAIEATQRDLQIAIGIATALEEIRSSSRRTYRPRTTSRSGNRTTPSHSNNPESENENNEEPTPQNLKARLQSADKRLKQMSEKSFKF